MSPPSVITMLPRNLGSDHVLQTCSVFCCVAAVSDRRVLIGSVHYPPHHVKVRYLNPKPVTLALQSEPAASGVLSTPAVTPVASDSLF